MSLIVLLDSGPLGLVTNPKESAESLACKDWLRQLTRDGHQALVPAITDYKVRRELKLYGKVNGLRNLDTLAASAGYVPLTPQNFRPQPVSLLHVARQRHLVSTNKSHRLC